VSDSGHGIDPAILPYIFEPFQQGDSSATTRSHQGLGLGLAIVRQLVSRHGGTVRADSPGKGQGSTFTVELPIIAVRVPRATRGSGAAAPAPVGSGETRLAGLRVLVVDDQPDARELVALILQQRGMDVRVAGSVAGALERLAEAPVDVLVSDLAMPGTDGYALIAAVRARERERTGDAIRAVALSAHAGHEVRDRALAAGFDAHATKPLDPDDLVELIAGLPRRLVV
jgi:CheY-like chemotaxis protein